MGEHVPAWLAQQAAPLGVPAWVVERWPAKEEGWETQMDMLKAAFVIIDECFDTAPRFRDCIDVCSGHGEFSFWCRSFGLIAHEFDCGTRHPSESLTSFHGVIWVGLLLLSIRPGGVMAAGPKCSTWLRFMSASTFGRCESIHGDLAMAAVGDANICAETVAGLMLRAGMRDVYVLIEQPAGSRFLEYPCIVVASRMVGAYRLFTWLGAFGHFISKPTEFLTTVPAEYGQRLRRPKPCTRASPVTVEGSAVTGGALMRRSEHYPTQLCQTMAQIVVDVKRHDIGIMIIDVEADEEVIDVG